MNKEMKSIRDINFAGKKVMLRVDFNVPVNEQGEITDDTRIRESMPTIEKLLTDGAAIIIMAHFGRPKNGFDPSLSLAPVAKKRSLRSRSRLHLLQIGYKIRCQHKGLCRKHQDVV